jgi:Uma2 family endonuclease
MFQSLEILDMTVEQFDEYALLPENREKRLEVLDGKIVELVSNAYSSNVGAIALTYLNVFVLQISLAG